jgi:glycosyltransferase involved in cell wall biosynthesis
MRILFSTEYYPPFAPGGSPWSIRHLAEALARRGHDVTVVTPNYGAMAEETVGGVRVRRFPFWRRLPAGPSLARPRDLVSPSFHWRLFRAVSAVGREVGAEVLHAQEKHALVGTYFAARMLRRPAFLTLREVGLICPIATCLLSHEFVPADCSIWKLERECAGFFLKHYHRGEGRLRRARIRLNLLLLYLDAWAKGFVIKRLDGLVSVSGGLLEIHLRAGRGLRRRSHVVYTPLPAEPPPDPAAIAAFRARHGLEGKRTVLYVGKPSLGKGWLVFVDAAEQVAREHPDVVFVGAGPDSPDRVPVGAALRWLGRLPHDAMPVLYGAADVVVLPAVGPEALSRVPLEAALAGRPTIGTRVGGIPEEIVDGQTGHLVPPGDAKALAVALDGLLRDDTLRTAMGENARRFVAERFDPDAVVRSLLDVYRAAGR